MNKIAIVGVEGSGKTVLMTVLGEKYQTPDQYGLFLSPETRETSDFHRVNLGKLENGEWPIETPHDSVRSLRWTLQRKYVNGENTVMADLNFLDFAGEIYREAFDGAADGSGGQWVDECETLRQHVKESDVLIVLVNLRNVVLKMTDERTNQVVWLSKGIVDYAKRELKIPHVALAFTQVDAYREVIEEHGGDLKVVLSKYLPDVSNVYSNLPLFALSAVDKTERGDDGLLRPAPGFGSKGLEELVHWILGCTEEGRKYAAEIIAIKNRPHDLWREIVAGMNALREDAAQPTGLSVAERFAKVSALQSAAAELAVNDLRHTVPDFTDERLAEQKAELDGWAKFAGLANEYVKAVEAKRNDIAAQLESNLVDEVAPSSLLLARVREEARQIRAAWWRRVVKCWLIAVGIVGAAAVFTEAAVRSHNAAVDRLVAERGYCCHSLCGVKYAVWKDGVKHPSCPDLKAADKPETWVCTKSGCQWDGKDGIMRILSAGDTKTIALPGGATMEMVWCPPCPQGFWMGSPTSEEGHCDDETQHRVILTQGFWMGKYEVTQRQWESVMGNNPSNFKGADRPVEKVSWDDCQEFVRKINAEGREMVSLPTEAQWEYACRAGTATPYNFGSSLNGDRANCNGNVPYGTTVKGRYREETAPVGSYAPNAWGLCDMHGNVWEWCEDRYDSDYYARSPLTDPPGPASGAGRVDRGGSWYDGAQYCRSAYRYGSEPGYRYSNLGLRLVCSAGPRR